MIGLMTYQSRLRRAIYFNAMPDLAITSNEFQKRSLKARKLEQPEISYSMAEGVSEEEMERRVHRAFAVLFSEIFKK